MPITARVGPDIPVFYSTIVQLDNNLFDKAKHCKTFLLKTDCTK